MGYKIRNNVLSRRRINSAKENGNDIMTYMSLKAGATLAINIKCPLQHTEMTSKRLDREASKWRPINMNHDDHGKVISPRNI